MIATTIAEPNVSDVCAYFPTMNVENFFQDFTRDVAAFERELPALLERMPGHFVAILQGQIIDHNLHWEDLLQATRERFPDRFVFIEQVAPRIHKELDMDTLDS